MPLSKCALVIFSLICLVQAEWLFGQPEEGQQNPSPELVQDQQTQPTPETEVMMNYYFPMLKDTIRNKAFRAAIERAVKPGMQVLDIGAGQGLLSLLAARSGAQVYACEKSAAVAAITRDIIQRNGYADNIHLINKESYGLRVGEDMPDKADILLAENLDSFLLGEWMLPIVKHAREHLLKPGAQIIPKAATVFIQLAETAYGFSPDGMVEGFDLSPFREHRLKSSFSFNYEVVPHIALTDVLTVTSFDFENGLLEEQILNIETIAVNSGSLNAIVMWWELNVDDQIKFSTGPNKNTHWEQGIVLTSNDITVTQGSRLQIAASHNTTSWSFSINILPS